MARVFILFLLGSVLLANAQACASSRSDDLPDDLLIEETDHSLWDGREDVSCEGSIKLFIGSKSRRFVLEYQFF